MDLTKKYQERFQRNNKINPNVEDPDKRFWKFEWFFESWYPMLFMLGEESDDIRYKEEKLQVGGTEKDSNRIHRIKN